MEKIVSYRLSPGNSCIYLMNCKISSSEHLSMVLEKPQLILIYLGDFNEGNFFLESNLESSRLFLTTSHRSNANISTSGSFSFGSQESEN